MNKLKAMRLKAGLSQSQLAKDVPMNLITLQRYEQGYRDINKASADMVFKIANALNCKPEDIMNMEE